jgi:argininosuccinate lyase
LEPPGVVKSMTDNGRKDRRQPKSKSTGIRAGRFSTGMDPLFASFNASISFDKRLAAEDVRGSIAHVRMLGRQRIISPAEARSIERGLKLVLKDVEEGRLVFRPDLEDVHINVEHALKEMIGEVAGKLHTARSRNDQVALDLRMYVRGRVEMVKEALVELMTAMVDKAADRIDLILPGYTHLQRAQPVRLSHHLMAYVQMFRRDWQRLNDSQARVDEMPLGSAALAGTTFPVDRDSVAQELAFSRVSPNSMDAVADRDFALEFLFDASMTMMHLSRLAEEIILWSSTEFGYCTLPDAFCSGSSIMPQKKNPDACELIRGKTGRVYGDLIALLTTLKALPLTYNKDLQEDKEPVFDAADTVLACVKIAAALLPGIEFHSERMLEAASDPLLAATDLADRLTRQGVPFREAHATIGAMTRTGITGRGKAGEQVPSPEEMVEARKHVGGTARASVMEQIREVREFLRARTKRGRRVTGKAASKRKD